MLDLDLVRTHFPGLASGAVFLDNPGGTQIAREALERISGYLVSCNANHEGAFPTSRASDALVEEARCAAADFLHASLPQEIVFGPNMTSLTFQVSRSLGRQLAPGDEIVVTRLDHDANITPWVLAARDAQAIVRWADFRPEDCTLDLEDLERQITPRTRLVAVGYASNATGTLNDVSRVIELAHAAGALCYVDAVHYAPHGPIDVRALGCDFLVCSAYKFFGPHVGVLYGRREVLAGLPAYKVRPASDLPPQRWETGTGNFEGIAGTLGALEYLTWLGREVGRGAEPDPAGAEAGRALLLQRAMGAIRAYETELGRALIERLSALPGLVIHGLTGLDRPGERVPTVSFTVPGRHPREIARALGDLGFYVWDGNFYALAVTERLGLEGKGGMVRVGPVHYNTLGELDSFADALAQVLRTSARRAPGGPDERI